jgi:chromosome segregation ATPase
MATTDPHSPPVPAPGQPAPGKRRNWWIWVSAALALVVVGLVVWQLDTQSDLDAAQKQVKDLQAQIDQGVAEGADAAAAYQAAYADLEQELGTTQQDLAQTEQELKDAQDAADQAQQAAAAAQEQAGEAKSAIDKAQAEADAANAQAEAAQAQVTITRDCANAFVGELTAVAQSEDPAAAAAAAKTDLQGIVDDCRAALAGS